MRIQRVRLHDFGKIGDIDLSFSDGMHVFTGNNGEGKSTILKAISLVLFNRYQGKLSDYIRWGCSTARVDLCFEYSGSTYDVSVEINTKGSSRTLTVDGDEYADSEVTRFLDELLDPKKAIAATLAFEHEVDIITTTPAERREYLKGVYDLTFREQISGIREDIDATKGGITQSEVEIRTLEAQSFPVEELLIVPRLNVEQVKLEIQKLQSREHYLGDILDTRKRLLSTLQSVEKEIGASTHKESVTQSLIDKNRSERSLVETKYLSLKEDEALIPERERGKVQKAIDENRRIISDWKEERSIRVGERDGLHKEIDDLPILEDKDFDAILSDLRQKIREKEQRKQSANSGICPLCGSTVGYEWEDSEEDELVSLRVESVKEEEAYDLVKKQRKRVEFLRSSLVEVEHAIEMLDRKIESTEAANQKDLERIQGRIEELLAMSQREQSVLRDREDDLNIDLQRLEGELSDVIERKNTLVAELESTQRQLADLPEDVQSEIAKIRESLSQEQKRIDDYYHILTVNEERRKSNSVQKDREAERDARVETLRSTLNSLRGHLTLCEKSLTILQSEFPSFVLSRLVRRLEDRANDFLKMVYPRYTLTFRESKKSLEIVYGPNDADIRMASGFEKQVASFAYKYALSELVGYRFLVLDEVDSAASEENSQIFYETLGKMSSMFDQMFVITHKPETKNVLVDDYNAVAYEVKGGRFEKVS